MVFAEDYYTDGQKIVISQGTAQVTGKGPDSLNGGNYENAYGGYAQTNSFNVGDDANVTDINFTVSGANISNYVIGAYAFSNRGSAQASRNHLTVTSGSLGSCVFAAQIEYPYSRNH